MRRAGLPGGARVPAAILLAVLAARMAPARGAGARLVPAAPSRVDVVGSDTALPLAVRWAEDFHRRRPDVRISVTGGGSAVGLACLAQGLCQVAASSRPAAPEERARARAAGRPLRAHPAALDAVAVIVHPSNPVPFLTFPQLRAIYSGRVTNWRQVGGPDRPVVALSRGAGSGTGQIFEEAVFGPPETRTGPDGLPRARQVPGSALLHDDVARTPEAIGYVGVGYVTPAVRAVPVARTPAESPVPPAVPLIAGGRYPLVRPILLYTAGASSTAALAFVDYALGPDGQARVAEAGFVPLALRTPARQGGGPG
ncbi:phosphate ABC transporter substrate-binding protein [Caldinitratiruptor microaerophilus]|uniref:Phosphate ABC transporter substrate-binding protein n=1 Tax=Caldinitratiruptor microaerophilus TaxID=671077 RepID=A0AA35GAR8_9FIRM|nr:phosphate ABC transporter substrate-binding protein [Caldinitratiruptor microaerophilus]BDG61594.1 phosphate ABC transporter substrate-binding protein [Caldinitratiruptor microaerophilus]